MEKILFMKLMIGEKKEKKKEWANGANSVSWNLFALDDDAYDGDGDNDADDDGDDDVEVVTMVIMISAK